MYQNFRPRIKQELWVYYQIYASLNYTKKVGLDFSKKKKEAKIVEIYNSTNSTLNLHIELPN